MKHYEYLAGVNKTWKQDDGLKELIHCQLAIIEEIGEIFGWYKKHFGYGKEKDTKWKAELIGELGDLLYYLTKVADISEADVEMYYEEPFVKTVEFNDPAFGIIQPMLTRMMDNALIISRYYPTSPEFQEAVHELFEDLHILICAESFEFEDVQLKNLAKLQARHGEKFNTGSIMEEGRDRDVESKVLGDGNN
jgi:NTP pyrophosphatase (non-canonical NTP hydrolase)